MTWIETFENPSRSWFTAGGAGFDYGKGLAFDGKGNGWIRGSSGWNALNLFHLVKPNTEYQVSALLRLSPGLTDGYFSVREARELVGNGRILNEVKLVGPSPYNTFSFKFATGNVDRVLFYIGLWGVGRDVWIQVDNFVLDERGGSSSSPGGSVPSCGVEVANAGFGQSAEVRVYGQGFSPGEGVEILRNGQFASSGFADSGGRYSVTYGQAATAPPTAWTVYARGTRSQKRSSSAGYQL